MEVLVIARKLAVELSLDAGDRLVATTKAGPLPARLLDLLKAARSDLVAMLKGQAQPPFGAKRPVDCTEVQWDTALLGLHHFLAGGHAGRALACGWSRPDLFSVPDRWSQIRLTGAGWLIGEWDIAAVDAEAITVSPPWSPSSQLKFRRQDDLHRLAAVTKVIPAAVPMPKVVRDSVADEAAISRFEEAAEALFGRGIEVVRR